MEFFITNGGPSIIGKLQILLMTNASIIYMICHKQHLQRIIEAAPIYLPLPIHEYIFKHLHLTIPFRSTNYAFSLSHLVDPLAPPPQIYSPLTFSNNLLTLQSHILEQLKLEIIEPGCPGNSQHQLLKVVHYNERKECDGTNYVANLVKVNMHVEKLITMFLLIQQLITAISSFKYKAVSDTLKAFMYLKLISF